MTSDVAVQNVKQSLLTVPNKIKNNLVSTYTVVAFFKNAVILKLSKK